MFDKSVAVFGLNIATDKYVFVFFFKIAVDKSAAELAPTDKRKCETKFCNHQGLIP